MIPHNFLFEFTGAVTTIRVAMAADVDAVIAVSVDGVRIIANLRAPTLSTCDAIWLCSDHDPLNDLGAELEGFIGTPQQQLVVTIVDNPKSGIVTLSARQRLARGLGDARLPGTTVEKFEHLTGEVALVGDAFRRGLGHRRRIRSSQIGLGRPQRRRQDGRIALIGETHLRCDHRHGFEIDRVFRFVGHVRGAILHLCNFCIRVDTRNLVRMRQLIALVHTVHGRQVVRRFRRDPKFLGHAAEHFAVESAAVLTHDRAQRQIVGAPPLDAPFRINALEVARHLRSQVPTRRDRHCPPLWHLIRRVDLSGERINFGRDPNIFKAVAEDVAWRDRHFGSRHHQITLSIPLPSQHSPSLPQSLQGIEFRKTPSSLMGC